MFEAHPEELLLLLPELLEELLPELPDEELDELPDLGDLLEGAMKQATDAGLQPLSQDVKPLVRTTRATSDRSLSLRQGDNSAPTMRLCSDFRQ